MSHSLQETDIQTKPGSQAKPSSRVTPKQPSPADESATEEEPEEEEYPVTSGEGKVDQLPLKAPEMDDSPARSGPSKRATPDQQSPIPKSRASHKEPSAPASSSPLPPPPKKTKRAQVSSSSDEEDSEEERKKRLARLKGSSVRGAKQPLKRGGKRF